MKALFSARIVGWSLLAIATLELCARTEDKLRYGAPFAGSYTIESLYGYDATGKHGLPNASYLKWKLNAEGFRGPSLQQGKYRIICIGASETFGIYESPGREWPRQVEEKLNEGIPSRPYEVVNTAYPGMSVGYSRKLLPGTLAKLHPQLAIIYPMYAAYIRWDPARDKAPAVAPQKHFQLRVAARVKTFLEASLPPSVLSAADHLAIKLQTRHARIMDRLPAANVETFSADLNQLVADLQNAGVDVILVTHASRFGSTPQPGDQQYLTDWRATYPQLREAGFLDMERRMTVALKQVGTTRNVPIVDAASLIEPGSKNFADFVHFTDAGADALSTLVAQQVEQQRNSKTSLRASASNPRDSHSSPARTSLNPALVAAN
jgi:lysophospholipase L1-like esterase